MKSEANIGSEKKTKTKTKTIKRRGKHAQQERHGLQRMLDNARPTKPTS